jgi:hypothetical protein
MLPFLLTQYYLILGERIRMKSLSKTCKLVMARIRLVIKRSNSVEYKRRKMAYSAFG